MTATFIVPPRKVVGIGSPMPFCNSDASGENRNVASKSPWVSGAMLYSRLNRLPLTSGTVPASVMSVMNTNSPVSVNTGPVEEVISSSEACPAPVRDTSPLAPGLGSMSSTTVYPPRSTAVAFVTASMTLPVVASHGTDVASWSGN